MKKNPRNAEKTMKMYLGIQSCNISKFCISFLTSAKKIFFCKPKVAPIATNGLSLLSPAVNNGRVLHCIEKFVPIEQCAGRDHLNYYYFLP